MALGTYKHKRSKVGRSFARSSRKSGSVHGMRNLKVKVLVGRLDDGGYQGWACIAGSPNRPGLVRAKGGQSNYRCGPTVYASGPTAVTKKALTALSKTVK